MGDYTEKGDALMAKAEKKLTGFSLFGGGSKNEEAAELYVQAANQFKIAKDWQRAGDAFVRAAECHEKAGNKFDTATNLVAASTSLKKVNPLQAVTHLKEAVHMYLDLGRFAPAAKYQKEIAEMYEAEDDMENATEAYQEAADHFLSEDSQGSATPCLVKVAELSALREDYDRAISTFDKVISASLDNNLLRWSVKDYFLHSGVCHLCKGDAVAAQQALAKFRELNPQFENTRESKFLEDITTAFEEGDEEKYATVVFEFDQVLKLSKWRTTMLLRVKNKLKETGANSAAAFQ